MAGLGVLATADLLPLPAVGWRPWQATIRAAAATRSLLLSRWGVRAGAVSLLSNLNFIVAALLLAQALGVPVTALDMLAVMPAVTLATTLPISLGGWGVREGLLVLLLGRLGVPAGDALTLSLLFGGFSVLCGVPGLLAWVVLRGSGAGAGVRANYQPGSRMVGSPRSAGLARSANRPVAPASPHTCATGRPVHDGSADAPAICSASSRRAGYVLDADTHHARAGRMLRSGGG
jgi:hypothetical protein